MTNRTHARGGVAAIVLPGLLVALGAGGLLAGHLVGESETTTERARYRVTRATARAWLVRAGLEPKALAAAGVSGNVVQVIVTMATNYLTQYGPELDQQDAARRQALAQLKSASTQEGLAAMPAATEAMSASEAQIDTLLDNMVTFCTGMVNAETVAKIRAVKRNRSYGLPHQFAIENRSEEEWIAAAMYEVLGRTADDRPQTTSGAQVYDPWEAARGWRNVV